MCHGRARGPRPGRAPRAGSARVDEAPGDRATAVTALDRRVVRGMEVQLARWRAVLARGGVRVGWKIGVNEPALQRRLGLTGPVVGHLTLATTLVPGEAHSLAGG